MKRSLFEISALLLAAFTGCGRSDCCSDGNVKLVSRIPLPSAQSQNDVPVRVGGQVVAPILIHKVEPILPDREKHAVRQQPFMFFELVVDRSGNVTSVRTLKANNETLVPYVIPAIRQWKFRPATMQGKPVTALYNISFSYEVR